ncbi:putative gamma-tubulin complex component gcp6 protein [Neofusicoccum parvum UCRNP2]|uniref:Spindle pole body component n=1 Tax=Botryosphaeria parva (strain UCR-NP2) TaxID=1287680 RepID=R1EQH1_BOTPV|nr:putative gamma-tubulin complex component gcp6 protein [Neofusicoccum parvum UCRNP2]
MGVLSESYHTSQLYHSTKNQAAFKQQEKRLRETPDLPGNLSFSIRLLSNEEIEKCMDPNSLYALDFLRLQYTPPPPLNLVMTTSALDKYDQCFRLLLRIVRMLFVVNHQLPRHGLPGVWESKSFRNEAHHFVSAVSSYFFDSGIGETWTAFEAALNGLERRMRAEDASSASTNSSFGSLVTEGLESVRAAHEECLDRILFALLLRRRQAQVMKLLEEIFETILAFAKRANDHQLSGGGAATVQRVSPDEAREIREMYMLFRSKVNVFMTVCRGLLGKRGGYGSRKAGGGSSLFAAAAAEKGGFVRSSDEENTIDRLLLKLEMNGYYSAPVATDLGLEGVGGS